MEKYSILIPLLSKHENNSAFLEKALENAKEVNILLVIDKEAMVGQFGFAASEIMQGNLLLENLKKKIEAKKIPCNDIMEWGNTEQKIIQLCQMKKADKIIFLEQDNKYFHDLLKRLEETGMEKIETIKVELTEQEQHIHEAKKMQPEEGQNIEESKKENIAEKKEQVKPKKKGHNVEILKQPHPAEKIAEQKDEPIIKPEEIKKAFDFFAGKISENRKKLEKIIREQTKKQ